MDWFLALARDNPFLAFLVICSCYYFATFPFRIMSRWIRHHNIKVAGWPPPYLDADGDPIENEKQKEA